MSRRLRLLGITVAVAALGYFVVYAGRTLAGQDLRHLLRPDVVTAGAVLTVLYMLLIPLTALAWSWLLRGLGQPVRFSITGPVLATTQIGKYLPGNVAHHLGRVVVGQAHGVENSKSIMSIAYETLLVLIACAHASALTFLWKPPGALAALPLSEHRGLLIVAISLGALTMMMAAPRIAIIIASLRSGGDRHVAQASSVHPGWLTSLGCYLLYLCNFALVGAGLWLVAKVLTPTPVGMADLILLIGAFASSWILGFFAPGAPAGLGVREAVLSIWLEGEFGAPVAVTMILMLRISTTLGDLFSFLWGSFGLARMKKIAA